MFNDISNTLQRRLEHLGIDTESALGPDRAFKIEEKRIEPGDTVYLLGTARDNPDVDDTTGEENTDTSSSKTPRDTTSSSYQTTKKTPYETKPQPRSGSTSQGLSQRQSQPPP